MSVYQAERNVIDAAKAWHSGEGDVRFLVLGLDDAVCALRDAEAEDSPARRDIGNRCGFIPSTPGYAPCTRAKGHDGPCAHDLDDSDAGRDEASRISGDAKEVR